jgi:hypothetical protein
MTTKQLAKTALAAAGADSVEFADAYGNKRVAVSAAWIARHSGSNDENVQHVVSIATSCGYVSPTQFRSVK